MNKKPLKNCRNCNELFTPNTKLRFYCENCSAREMKCGNCFRVFIVRFGENKQFCSKKCGYKKRAYPDNRKTFKIRTVCVNCNQTFIAKNNSTKYCLLCRSVLKQCFVCSKAFACYTSSKKEHCSRECSRITAASKVKGQIRKIQIIKKCLSCKEDFNFRKGQKYCSTKCAGVATGERCRIKDHPKKKCALCEKEFEYKRKDFAGKYCSRKCSDSVNKNPPVLWFEKTCEVCEKQYKFKSKSTANRRKTCSRKCANKLKEIYGKNHPLYRRIDMNCEFCGKAKAVIPAKINEFRFCSRQCLGANMAINQPRISSIELVLKEQFDIAGLDYEQQFPIDYYIPDFAFVKQKLVVECDGDYWHNLPKQKAKDRRKNGYYKLKGWRVIRFWEHEINKNPEKCLEKVLELLQ